MTRSQNAITMITKNTTKYDITDNTKPTQSQEVTDNTKTRTLSTLTTMDRERQHHQKK